MLSTTLYRRGDVVRVPFPFTNLRNSKMRPAVVLSVDGYLLSTGDLILAQITSAQNLQPHMGDYILIDWQNAGLRAASVVRTKVFSIHRSLIAGSIGKLSPTDLACVESALRSALGL